MGLNEILNEKLTSEEKNKFERDNGKLKLLRNIGVIPVLFAIFGVYLDSILIVFISVLFIIAFLVFMAYFNTRKGKSFYNIIIPHVLSEKFDNIEFSNSHELYKEEYIKSRLNEDYDILDCSNTFKIIEEKYCIDVCKVISKVKSIEEEDGVENKDIEENFSGIFAFVRLPFKFSNEFRVIQDQNDDLAIHQLEKLDTEFIKMNNTEFDSIYSVYSMDQISIRKVLTPGTLARILEINKKVDKAINFSIYDSTLYMAVNYEQFLDFKGNNKEIVNEVIAEKNLEILEQIDYFVRYMLNNIEVKNN